MPEVWRSKYDFSLDVVFMVNLHWDEAETHRPTHAGKVRDPAVGEFTAVDRTVGTQIPFPTGKPYRIVTRQDVQALDTPPYEAFGVTCGITFTFGGLRINHENGQVLDVGYAPIPGLYAAGEMVGGIFYFNYPAGTGLVSGLVFGRIAGGGAAAEAKAR